MKTWGWLTVVSLVATACGSVTGDRPAEPSTADPVAILSGLSNPRGVAIAPDGSLFVAEAGTGRDTVDLARRTGRLTRFSDRNGDGDFDDPGEGQIWFDHLPTYNAFHVFDTGRDEVNGPGDVLLHRDGRVFLSIDGGFEDIGLFEISPEGVMGRNLSARSNMNGLAFDRNQEHIYAVESSLNRLIEISLSGEIREVVTFGDLASGQQAVPAGVAVDPLSDEVLVALFSGAVRETDGVVIPFVPGDAKVVRVDPASGEITGEIAGLTTAVDVAVDGSGNVYVVEMASGFAGVLPDGFDLYDPDAPPLDGGYLRFSGRVTVYPVEGGTPSVLADGLDAPTNVTVDADGKVYVSIGEGTPGRPILGPAGAVRIDGAVMRLEP